MKTNDKLFIAYGSEYLNWQLGEGHPTNPDRALLAVNFLGEALESGRIEQIEPSVKDYDKEDLYKIHDKSYVDDVVEQGFSSEWSGKNKELGTTALQMFAGTARLTELMIVGEARVAFNPQGAKHHAHYNHSSGFCVFNDMAFAAKEFHRFNLKPMYIDWDAHHGDGVEKLLLDTDIPTCSIHQRDIYPFSGNEHDIENHAYNWALPNGAGDGLFARAMDEIVELADKYQPDVVLLATGADAHKTDPLSGLQFDYPGYAYAAKQIAKIANKYSNGRVLIGGAGGYQPYTHTPKIWAEVVKTVYSGVTEKTTDPADQLTAAQIF